MAKTVTTIAGSNDEILAQLQALQSSDKKAETTSQYGCLVCLLGALTLFGPKIVAAPTPPWLAVLGLAILVVGVVVHFRGKAGDVDDARYLALQRLHRYLSGDVDKAGHYHYVLDLRPYTDRAFLERTEPFGGWFNLPRGTIEYFLCPVLYGQVKLRDGTAVSVSVDRKTRRRTRTQRGYSGKTKTKTKSKASTLYSVKVKLPEGPPVHLTQAPSTAASAPLYAQVKKQRSLGDRLTATAVQKVSEQALEIDGLLQLLTQVFYQVHDARRSAS